MALIPYYVMRNGEGEVCYDEKIFFIPYPFTTVCTSIYIQAMTKPVKIIITLNQRKETNSMI